MGFNATIITRSLSLLDTQKVLSLYSYLLRRGYNNSLFEIPTISNKLDLKLSFRYNNNLIGKFFL